MICCIKHSINNKKNFDIIYKDNNGHYVLKDSNNNKETLNENNILSPLVLFYKNLNDIDESNNNDKLEKNTVNINENCQLNNKNIINNAANILNQETSLNNNINKDLLTKNKNNKLSLMNVENNKNLQNDMNHIINIEVESKKNKDKQKKNEENQINNHVQINGNEINLLNNTYNNCYNENIQLITLHFELTNGKELYLEVQEKSYLKDVIEELNNKYLWLKKIGKIDYFSNGKKINRDKTVKENGLSDSSIIMIIEE
jgi:hypothetical protein